MMPRISIAVVAIAVALSSLVTPMAPSAMAEEMTGITITGDGTIKAKPVEVQIQATVVGEAELASDASVKFRDLKKKAIAAIDGLKNPDLSVESKGSSVNQTLDPMAQQRMMNGQGGDVGKGKVQVSESLNITLKNADKLDGDKLLDTVLKLIDAGRDAGLQIGPPSPSNYYEMQMRAQNGEGNSIVAFRIPDISSAESDAYKLAVADARNKAEKIAQLSGVKLGRVLSVRDRGSMNNGQTVYYNQAPIRSTDKSASSSTYGEIPVSVQLQVQFDIEK